MLNDKYKKYQRGLKTKTVVCFVFIPLFLTVAATSSLGDVQGRFSVEKVMNIIENIKEKIIKDEELSEEEWRALEILERSQRKSQQEIRKGYSIDYSTKGSPGYKRYRIIQGTESAIGEGITGDILCEQKLIDNKDKITFTYIRRTKEGYIEKWVFLKNANPFYWANYWKNIDSKLKELVGIKNQKSYQLPPSKVLIEISKLSRVCPDRVSSITGTDVKIFNTETVIPYWANEEYFFSDSGTTRYAAIVSFYFAKRGWQNKDKFGIIWPCYLQSREKRTGS